MIVAGDRQHAAVRRGAGRIGVLATRRAERSTPGPLPYQMPNTPSTLAPGNSPTCWLPHTAVAARSSLSPGWKAMSCACRNDLRAPQRVVVHAERRTAIAGNKAGGVESCRAVALRAATSAAAPAPGCRTDRCARLEGCTCPPSSRVPVPRNPPVPDAIVPNASLLHPRRQFEGFARPC